MQKKPVAFITGASSGFGAAIAQRFAKLGYALILLARRGDRLQKLAAGLATPTHLITCDVRDRVELEAKLKALPRDFQAIDILVNNAGLALGLSPAHQASWAEWEQMIETNCSAVAFLTRQILPGMVERGRGHVFLMGSVAGNYAYPGGNVYGATKAFVAQLARGLRADLIATGVRVTNIVPGLAGGTEFSQVRFSGDGEKAKNVYAGVKPLGPEDVAECVLWAHGLPAHVNINEIELMPEAQASGPLAVHRST